MDPKIVIITGLLVSACLTTLLSVYAIRRLSTTAGSGAYIGLLISVTLYTVGYALELFQTTLEGIIFSLRIEYLGLPFIPVFWFLLALRYTGYFQKIPQWLYGILFCFSLVTLVLHYTNDHHHLFYKSLSINAQGPFPLAAISKGTWYYVNIQFTNICVIAGNILFFWMMRRSVGPLRRQAAAMFSVSLIPWIGNIVYQTGYSPYGIDIIPFTLTLTGPLFAVAMFRFRMFDVVPIARGRVFDIIQDPVMVLDKYNHLADFNRAAANVFKNITPKGIGTRIDDLLIRHPKLSLALVDNEDLNKEVQIIESDTRHFFDTRMVPIKNSKSKQLGKLVIFHDVTSQRQLLDRLKTLATRDDLTGIFNRRHFMDLSREEIARAKRYGHPISLIIMDLDNFKQINDAHGHQAGDEVLRSFARLLSNSLRSFDILGRYGGEEFALALPETTPENGLKMAERLRRNLNDHRIPYLNKVLSITASFGLAGISAQDDIDLDTLLYRADKALYRAKNKGRNRVEAG